MKKLRGKAGITEEYFAVQKENTWLMEALDDADNRLKQERPFYISSIYESYYGVPYQKLTGMTREEYDFINSGQTVRVACDASSYPLEYVDEKTGEYAADIRGNRTAV